MKPSKGCFHGRFLGCLGIVFAMGANAQDFRCDGEQIDHGENLLGPIIGKKVSFPMRLDIACNRLVVETRFGEREGEALIEKEVVRATLRHGFSIPGYKMIDVPMGPRTGFRIESEMVMLLGEKFIFDRVTGVVLMHYQLQPALVGGSGFLSFAGRCAPV